MPKILIIDDDPDILEIAQASLEIMNDWDVITALSGQEGLQKAAIEQPDAVLLDMGLPDFDGISTLEKLQESPKTKHIPVVFLTAKSYISESVSRSNQNLPAVLMKPFHPERLGDQIAQMLGWNSTLH